jgi:hypothetical protein
LHLRDASRCGLDAAIRRADLQRAMENRPAPRPSGVQDRPLLDLLPAPMRRASGVVALTLTLWLASFLALIR